MTWYAMSQSNLCQELSYACYRLALWDAYFFIQELSKQTKMGHIVVLPYITVNSHCSLWLIPVVMISQE